MTTNNHPAHGPVSLDRLHQIREILSKAAAQSDGGNLGYAMADAVKVIDEVLESIAREQVRREHAAWSQATFGDVGPVGPLKHLSKEALEAAAEPGDLSEWADMQFLLWDAQRRVGISDKQITLAMVEKLAVNKQREWPEPKDGEPRQHIKELAAPVVSFYRDGINAAAKWVDQQREAYDSEHGWSDPDTGSFEFGNDAQRDYSDTLAEIAEGIRSLHPNAGNPPVIPEGYVLVPIEPTEDMIVEGFESEPDEDFSDPAVWEKYLAMSGCQQAAHRAKLCWAAMIAAAPKPGDSNG